MGSGGIFFLFCLSPHIFLLLVHLFVARIDLCSIFFGLPPAFQHMSGSVCFLSCMIPH